MSARSLSAQQQATEVIGNNLANVNNPAYAREQLVLQASVPLETPQGEEGTGVDAVSIQEFRNAFLDGQISNQTSVTGSLTSQQSALQEAETYLDEQVQNSSAANTPAGSENGIAHALDALFNGFQTVAEPGSGLPERQTLVSTAQGLASKFNQVSTELGSVRDSLNQSIQADVASSNQDLKDIAQLNLEIATATATGGTANSLVDARQAKLEDLASKTNITTSTEANGAVDVSIGGVTMVSGFANSDQMEAYDAGGGQFLVRAQSAGTNLALTGGSIAGSISARDGELTDLQNSLNTLASNLITQVNAIYTQGFGPGGVTGGSFFTGTDASDISVSSDLAADPTIFQGSGSATAAGDNSTVAALGALGHQNITGLQNQTFSGSYATTVTSLGNAIANVTDQLGNSQSVAQMLGNQRSSISGVNTDEEMTNLISYQKAYQASAQLISTINQMLETVLTMKTV